MPTAASPAVCSPLEGFTLAELPGIISDPYHPPPPGREERHQGVDFAYYRKHERASTAGNPVQAALPGVVAMALAESFPYGNVVIVETPAEELPAGLAEALGVGPGESVYSLYAHLADPPEVALGDGVAGCQALGQVGRSGNAGTPHLHLETRIGKAGERFTGMAYYTLAATPELREAYLRWRISGDFRHFDPMRLLEGEDGGDSGLP
jgi:murein DD-endopeptidase MepM/ murein hydrolase activator NlpD